MKVLLDTHCLIWALTDAPELGDSGRAVILAAEGVWFSEASIWEIGLKWRKGKINLQPRRILDLGTGSGILAMAAAKLLRRPVLATDIEPWSIKVTRRNADMNRVGKMVRPKLADGWRHPAVRHGGPYDLVFGNILARPLCAMAKDLAANLKPGGTAILAGLLATQARMVLAAHRRNGLRLEKMLPQGPWTTLVVRKSARRQAP